VDQDPFEGIMAIHYNYKSIPINLHSIRNFSSI